MTGSASHCKRVTDFTGLGASLYSQVAGGRKAAGFPGFDGPRGPGPETGPDLPLTF